MSRPRIRTVKPEFFQDEKVGHLSVHGRLLFLGLITMADDEGRLRDHINAIHAHVFPYDSLSSARVKKALVEVAQAELILRYKAGVGEYIVIRHWGRHQRINKPVDSTLPPPPDPVIVEENSFADSGEARAPRGAIPEAVRRAVARREGATPGATTDVACHYCSRPGEIVWPTIASGRASSWVTLSGLEFDHVIPVARGGEHTLDNLVLACARCNRSKGARDVGTDSSTDNVRESVHPPAHSLSRAGARSVPFLEVEEGVKEPELIDARATSELGQLVGEVVAVLRQLPRLFVNEVGVENAIAGYPNADAVLAARQVVTWASDPSFQATDAARLLMSALSKQKPVELDAKAARTAKRKAALKRVQEASSAA